MFALFKPKLSQKEEFRLKNHSYRSVDKSILSAYIFKKYTSMILSHTPEVISPNLLTLLGFIIMLINFILVIFYDPEFICKENWLALLSGMSLFFYFTMDNLDGAQARKLNEMSPMGQLFDHGVDSCAVFFCMITMMSSLRLGLTHTSIMVMLSVMFGFYFSGLEEKFTGVFEFGLISGPTEGIMLMVILHLLSAFQDNTIKSTVENFTHYAPLTRIITYTPISPLFLLALFVFTYNYITSYLKSLRLTNIKNGRDVFLSYASIGLICMPLYQLHFFFTQRADIQIINFMIFAQIFSLKYIEEVYCNIIGRPVSYVNFIYLLYILSGSFISRVFPGYEVFMVVSFFFLSTIYYLRSIINVVVACKTALKINVLALNKKKAQ